MLDFFVNQRIAIMKIKHSCIVREKTLKFEAFCLKKAIHNIFDKSVAHQLLCESLPIFLTCCLLPGHWLLILLVTLTFQLKVKP